MTTLSAPEISATLSATTPPPTREFQHLLLDDVRRLAKRTLAAEEVTILLASPNGAGVNGGDAATPAVNAIYEKIAASDKPVILMGGRIIDGLEACAADAPVCVGVPLFGLDSRRVGSLCVLNIAPTKSFAAEEMTWLIEFGELVSKLLCSVLNIPVSDSGLEGSRGHRATQNTTKLRASSRPIYSRASFLKAIQKRIDVANEFANGFAVLVIDIDSFKRISDSFEREGADSILSEVGRRLQEAVAPAHGSGVARLGSDQFAVLMAEAASEADAVTCAAALEYLLRAPIDCEGHQVFLTASVGIAVGSAGSYVSAEQMLEDAQVAKYRAKRQGKAQCVVFSQTMRYDARARLRLESDLRTALREKQFELFYQPKVKLETGAVKGFEALIRWRHPERGMVSPLEFIPAAEETGLICDISRWVVGEAIRQLAEWRRAGTVSLNATMAVNLSARQFHELYLLDWIKRELQSAAVPPQCLTLEVTESVLVENADSALDLFNKIIAEGMGLDLDDFGTGFSCLSYLHQFPFRSIKIDRSFVNRMSTEPQSVKLVASIVGLARSLDMGVIAEGVETEAQIKHLSGMGCAVAQGYLFSPPKPASQMEGLLQQRRSLLPLGKPAQITPMAPYPLRPLSASGFHRNAALRFRG
jgi:diguanylate cyclase (GGDEF)-like protein